MAAPREQGQHYIDFPLNPKYSTVSAISYMRHHSSSHRMDCSILKLYCMLVHHTNEHCLCIKMAGSLSE